MAGVNVAGSGRGGRRALDCEINAVPMVDLMFVTIAFLILTAAWTQMKRLEAAASVPGENTEPVTKEAERKVLEVRAIDDRVVLEWKRGAERTDTAELTIDPAKRENRFDAVSAKVKEMWQSGGEHRNASDRTFDRATVRVPNQMAYREVIGLMDAINQARRPVVVNGKSTDAPAFELTFAK